MDGRVQIYHKAIRTLLDLITQTVFDHLKIPKNDSLIIN